MATDDRISGPYFSSAVRNREGKIAQFFDATDLMANKYGLYFDIYAIKSKAHIAFKAFLDTFVDNFEMKTEQKQYVNSQHIDIKQGGVLRKLDIAFSVPSGNIAQAKLHMQSLNLLVKCLYAVANSQGLPSSVGAPRFKIRLLNLMTDSETPPKLQGKGSAASSGLEGYIDGLSYEFDMEAGFMTDPTELGFVYPKLIKISFSYYPVTEKNPMWEKTTEKDENDKRIDAYKFNLGSFPYGHKGLGNKNNIIGSSDSGATTRTISKQNKKRIDKLLGR